MGLQYGYDEPKGKWYAKGFMFLRYYNSKEEMESDDNAFPEYIKRLEAFHTFSNILASMR